MSFFRPCCEQFERLFIANGLCRHDRCLVINGVAPFQIGGDGEAPHLSEAVHKIRHATCVQFCPLSSVTFCCKSQNLPTVRHTLELKNPNDCPASICIYK